MKLLTKEIRRQLPKLRATECVPDPIAVVKFFNPTGVGTWYAVEFDGEDTFFGLVDLLEEELGYFSLSELEEYVGPFGLGIERDIYFTPKPVSQLRRKVA